MSQLAIISLKSFSSKSAEDLGQAVRALSDVGSVNAVSSVFRLNRQMENYLGLFEYEPDLAFEALVVSVLLGFDGKSEVLAEKLRDLESKFFDPNSRRTLSAQLLMFDQEVIRTPLLCLPHPEFHLKPEDVILAGEIAPDLKHPVLKTKLNDLAHSLRPSTWGEFYCQGHVLLDKG